MPGRSLLLQALAWKGPVMQSMSATPTILFSYSPERGTVVKMLCRILGIFELTSLVLFPSMALP